MDYFDFEIVIGEGTGRTYPVTVVHSDAGEASATMSFPFDGKDLKYQLSQLQVALLRSGGTRRNFLLPEESTVREFGSTLFNALFTGDVRALYAVAQDKARTKGRGVRLKLRIQASELAALPWEFLYDTRVARYICLSSHTPIVRYPEVAQAPQALSVTAPLSNAPLSILAMTASPKDWKPLDLQRERELLEEALKPLQDEGKVRLTWLEGHTWFDLQKALRRGRWHIFHFIGHGGFSEMTQEGLIALENEEGKAYRLYATRLSQLLTDHYSLRLVVLNSCEGARGNDRDVFSSMAATLIRNGVPAVLAMQYEITDKAAMALSRSFYDALAEGRPVDMAVSEARKAISMEIENSLEWGTPVLYMRSPDGKLFEVSQTLARKPEIVEARSVHAQCPACGAKLPSGAPFCSNCGRRLASVVQAPQSPPSPVKANASTEKQPDAPARSSFELVPVSQKGTDLTDHLKGGPQAPSTPPPLGRPSGPPTKPHEAALSPSQLPMPQTEQGPRISRRALLGGGLGAAAVAAGMGLYFLFRSQASSGSPLPITFVYSTEKTDWLAAAVDAFHGSQAASLNGKTIQVQLSGLDSVASQDQILKGQLKPTAWCPGSFLELHRLNFKWRQANNGKDIIPIGALEEPISLATSPLVFAVWQERAQVLLSHYRTTTLDRRTIHDALMKKSWADLGGQASWGSVKFGLTLPDQSNSGLLTLTLLAYTYAGIQRGLSVSQVNDPGFLPYLNVFEGAVNGFGHSSAPYLKDVIRSGPPQADVITTYENLALTHQNDARALQNQPLLLYYPSLNILSTHPFAILQGDWVTSEEHMAALQFRDFLLAEPQQRLALQFGFRPTPDSKVQLMDKTIPSNPFLTLPQLSPNHVVVSPIQPLAQPPIGEVIDALITLWEKNYPNLPTLD